MNRSLIYLMPGEGNSLVATNGNTGKIATCAFLNIDGSFMFGPYAAEAGHYWPDRYLPCSYAALLGESPLPNPWRGLEPPEVAAILLDSLALTVPQRVGAIALLHRKGLAALESYGSHLDGWAKLDALYVLVLCCALLPRASESGTYCVLDAAHFPWVDLAVCDVHTDTDGRPKAEMLMHVCASDDESAESLLALTPVVTRRYPGLQGTLIAGNGWIRQRFTDVYDGPVFDAQPEALLDSTGDYLSGDLGYSIRHCEARNVHEFLDQEMDHRVGRLLESGGKGSMTCQRLANALSSARELKSMQRRAVSLLRAESVPVATREGDLQLGEISLGVKRSRPRVVFLSRFTWGKSTLINAILGKLLLSTDRRAEQKAATSIVHGEDNRVVVVSKRDVESRSFSDIHSMAQCLRELNSVRGSSDSHDLVIFASAEMPDTLREVVLVDTPGYSGPHEEHDSLADLEWQDADLVLALYGQSQVGEKHFNRKVTEILEAGKKVLFVVSMRDKMSGDLERQEALLAEELSRALGTETEPLFVSGYQGLWARMWICGQVSMDDVAREKDLYVYEDGYPVFGRSLRPAHAEVMLAFSQIEQLERQIAAMVGLE